MSYKLLRQHHCPLNGGKIKESIDAIPAETSEIVRTAFPQGHKYLQMRDVLGTISTDDVFADLYPPDGQPAILP